MTSRVAMVDPAAEYAAQKAEIDAALARVLASGRFILGPEGEALERELAAFTGAAHAVGCASGTDALHLALVAAGIGPGDEVVVPAFTFFATAEAVSYTGATPVFADVDPASFNLTRASIAARLTAKTRAVIAVHLFGRCAPLKEISALCVECDLALVEDCAQALGADCEGRRAGSWGDFGCFSFYPTKNLAAAGDAGLVTAREARHAEALRMLRHHGSRKAYEHERIGWNSRLDELQAAVLRVKLGKLDAYNAARAGIAAEYAKRLARLPLALPAADPHGTHAWHQYTLRSPRRDALKAALEKADIASAIYYPVPLHRQPAYAADNKGLALPASEAAAREVLSIPMHPLLKPAELERVCRALEAACA